MSSESRYAGISAKDAALGIMVGVETVMNENGLKLRLPLKETRMLMIAEEAIEQAVATETNDLRQKLTVLTAENKKLRDRVHKVEKMNLSLASSSPEMKAYYDQLIKENDL